MSTDSKKNSALEAALNLTAAQTEVKELEDRLKEARARLATADARFASFLALGKASVQGSVVPDDDQPTSTSTSSPEGSSSLAKWRQVYEMMKANPSFDYKAAARQLYGTDDAASYAKIGALITYLRRKGLVESLGHNQWRILKDL